MLRDNSRPRIFLRDCFQENQMKNVSKNNVKCPFFPSLPKYEWKWIFCKNVSSYYMLSNVLRFALVSKILTFKTGLGSFLFIVVGEQFLSKNSDKKNKPGP